MGCASPDGGAPSPPADASAQEVSVDARAVDTGAADASAPEAAADATAEDDAGASAALTLDYTNIDCAAVEAVSLNDGGIRQTEICDRGRPASPRYTTVRDCAAALTTDAALVRRIADDGAYMNPSRHPDRDFPCSRFATIYPAEQVQHALWCLRHTARCNDDGSLR